MAKLTPEQIKNMKKEREAKRAMTAGAAPVAEGPVGTPATTPAVPAATATPAAPVSAPEPVITAPAPSAPAEATPTTAAPDATAAPARPRDTVVDVPAATRDSSAATGSFDAPPAAPVASTPITPAPDTTAAPVAALPAPEATPAPVAAPISLDALVAGAPPASRATAILPKNPPRTPDKPSFVTRIKYIVAGVVGGLLLGLLVGTCTGTKKSVDCSQCPQKPVAARVETAPAPAPVAVVLPPPVERVTPPAAVAAPPKLCGNGVIDRPKEECDPKAPKNGGCPEDKRCSTTRCKCVDRMAGIEAPSLKACKNGVEINSASEKKKYSNMIFAVHAGVGKYKGIIPGGTTVKVSILVCPPGNIKGVAKVIGVTGAGDKKKEVIRSVSALLSGKALGHQISEAKKIVEEVDL